MNLVLVRLQWSKTDITFSLHAELALFNLFGRFMSAHLLERMGSSIGDCAFLECGKCLVRSVPEGLVRWRARREAHDGPDGCRWRLRGPRGHAAFLQGEFLGATSPKGPAAQARAVFGGVAPVPPVFRRA